MLVWTDDEIRQFLGLLAPRWELMFRTVLLTGVRIGELIAMRWCNLDWDEGVYYVRERWDERTNGLEVPKTPESISPVDVPPSLLRDLRIQQQAIRERQEIAWDWYDNDLIFPTRKGTPTRTRSIYKVFFATMAEAGVRRITFHGLRHTYISHLIRQGENIKVIQRKARHKNIQTTLDRYGHLFPDDTASASRELETKLFGPPNRENPE